MNNPLKVSLENIIPLTEARDHFSQIVNEVQKDKLYVLTKGGKPAVAIIDVKYLETLTGGEIKKENVQEEIKKAPPEKVGLPSMIEHQRVTPPPVPPVAPPPIPKPAGFAAPQPKPQPAPAPVAVPTPPPPKNPEPLKTPPIEDAGSEKIEVKFSQEPPADDKAQTQSRFTSPDDNPPPAQYGNKAEEPEDMSID